MKKEGLVLLDKKEPLVSGAIQEVPQVPQETRDLQVLTVAHQDQREK